VFAELAKVYVPLAAGAAYGILRKPSEEQLSFFEKLILDVLMPLVIFTSTYSRLISGDFLGLRLIALSALCSAAALAAARLLRFSAEEALTAMYANAGYIPLGVATSFWGQQGAASVGFYIIGNNAFSNTAAPLVLGGKSLRESSRRLLAFPPLYGLFLGLALSLARAQLPEFIASTLSTLASTAPPLALMAVGLEMGRSLGRVEAGDLKPYALRVSLAVPLTLLFAAAQLVQGIDARVAFIESVMPSAASCIPVARALNLDAAKTARIVLVSTLFSTLVMLPFAVMLVR